MSMTLNPVNEAAFQKAVQSLETLNRAAVFHPTGTGKSCIAWKVVEAHPQTTFFWLVAGAQRLALRQAELTRYNGGTLPGNVRFCDCEKLAAATPEQWVRLGEQKPGCIVLDCYHELSAVCWAQSVQKLLRMCPQAKVLGLGVPNGAPVCAAAQELFADCIVSHMTVAEAMAAGTMPVPSAYAALLWPQEEELATLRARIKNLCMPKGDTSLRVQYEELSWSLRQVENLTVLLPRLLSDTSGHYLVLFESAAYQEKLGTELEQLLRTVDPAVRFYAADHACFADSAAVETFLSDTAPGPKVLLCVNAPGVQQPLEGLAGVILVRQSSLMSTFKQMLCRALVAAGSRSVPVFDLVAQFEGLGNGRTLQRDCTEAMTRAGSKTPGFRQERPMQQTYRLYGKLRREMEARWEVLCQAAADAAADDVADLATLFRPKQRGAGAHAHHDRPLLPAQRQTAHADGGELLDLDRAHTVNVAVHIRGAHAGERDVADVRELQAVRGEEVAERAVERGERVLRLHAQHINDCAVLVQPHDLRAAAADVNAQNNAHFALLR